LASPIDGAAKKKKKKKKRCLNIGTSCTTGAKKKCCKNLRCDSAGGGGPNTFCCKTEGSCRFGFDCCFGWTCVEPQKQCEQITSDRALKTNFATVDPADMLERVRDLPISTWNYTADDPAVRHVGPMAQDFAALFNVGADDRHSHPLDGQGVALAAIQGLLAQIDELQADNARLAARVAALERSEEPMTMPYNEAPASTT
ncbi:MAG: hypothetical protein K0S78_1569, partial [Thermomicrobiales bacterium]|nr:hypothetical protein [Thermomicrobiales bacterium]